MQDPHDFTIFLVEGTVPPVPAAFALYFQVDDVRRSYETLSGPSFRIPTATPSDLWDERSMNSEG